MAENEGTFFRIGPLDDETTALLMELSEATHCPPAKIAAAILRDVLADDAMCHGKVCADQPPAPKLH